MGTWKEDPELQRHLRISLSCFLTLAENLSWSAPQHRYRPRAVQETVSDASDVLDLLHLFRWRTAGVQPVCHYPHNPLPSHQSWLHPSVGAALLGFECSQALPSSPLPCGALYAPYKKTGGLNR